MTNRQNKRWKKSEVKKLIEIVSMAKYGEKKVAYVIAAEQLGRTAKSCSLKYKKIEGRKAAIVFKKKPKAVQNAPQETQSPAIVAYIFGVLTAIAIGAVVYMVV